MSDNHEHTHPHDHGHTHGEAASPEETLALLAYMLGHNRHHAEELHELAHNVENEEARALIHAAVDDLQSSSDKLAEALALWKGE